ncbi:MAG: UvrD-helicase domain-containing protein [Kiritimatiellae bacterium]|nr:UvrD-helicase domain-containing protein [Kiritimatiellia bacterium]
MAGRTVSARNLTEGLNPEQRKGVTTIKGPLLVLAGAGTGKTRVITHRIAYMLANGIAPRSILAMTFTNKAADEMKARIAQLVPAASAGGLTVGTFHAFCVRALRPFADRVGVRRNFGICDAADQLVAMRNAMRDLRIPESTLPAKACLARVSLLKNRLIGAEQVLAAAAGEIDELVGRAYQRYDRGLRASGVLDFDDLLLCMVRLLQDKKTLALFRKRYAYVLVDEYQDTNGPQYEIVKRIGEKHRNVCVVGDDDQSIYGWRGADVSKILHFEKDFPEATVVRLETNYRSTAEILNGANAVIRNNAARHKKSLRSAAGKGEAIAVVQLDNEEAEAAFVVEDILRRAPVCRARLGEFAILFRTQVQPRLFEMQLRERRMPYVLVGGMSFFDRKEIRDALAYLRLVANPTDELSLLRVINVPPRGIGQATVEKALAIAARDGMPLARVFERGPQSAALPPAAVEAAQRFLATLAALRPLSAGAPLVELIKRLVRDVDYLAEIKRCYPAEDVRTARWAALHELLNMAELHARGRKDATLASFLEDLTLSAAEDMEDEEEAREDAVTLMTLHSAKGLEFEEVYLVGMEEGLLPHAKSIAEGTVEEERRLAYVGMTRAKRRLSLTFTRTRARYGQRAATMASRFIYEMRGEQAPLPQSAEEQAPKPAASVAGDRRKAGRARTAKRAAPRAKRKRPR